jgi:hypothetical protein
MLYFLGAAPTWCLVILGLSALWCVHALYRLARPRDTGHATFAGRSPDDAEDSIRGVFAVLLIVVAALVAWFYIGPSRF